MLKFKVELELGNEAMLSVEDVKGALDRALFSDERALNLVEGDGGVLRDANGNRVGVWGVERERKQVDSDDTWAQEHRTYRESAYDRGKRLYG